MNNPGYIIIHTAAFNGDASPHVIDSWHQARGFSRYPDDWPPEDKHRLNTGEFPAFGYHYYVRKNGSMFQIRHHLERGCHCRDGGMNRKSIGICFEGHGDHYDFTGEQYKSGAIICRSIIGEFEAIRVGGPARILGHREVAGVKKSCPGLKIDMDIARKLFFHAK